jgi:hypothetical protein
VQVKLWSDFFLDSLDLINQVKSQAKFCSPGLEDRGGEVERAQRLYALGRSLSLDGLDDPELFEVGRNMQNWLTEVSANDTCISTERSHELLELARMMELESKASMFVRNNLKEVES